MPPTPPRQLLIRGVNWLGDAVMTTPALLRLRKALPRTRITLLTHAKLAELWQQHPAVDAVLTFAGEGAWSVSRRLRAGGYDAALVLPNSPRSALEPWLARIPCRVGFARPWRNWLLTHAIPSRPGRVAMRKRTPAEIRELIAGHADRRATPPTDASEAHQIHEYLHLVAAFGAESTPVAPFLCVKAEEIEAARSKFAVPAGTVWLGLNPGAEYGPAKRWPAEHFIAAAKQVSAVTGARWLVFGGRTDSALAGEIAAGLGESGRSLAGATSLRELMALLCLCPVLLTNDTGPMHLAAALGTRVIVPFGSTSPELTGPGLPGDSRHRLLRNNVPCAPCFLRDCPIDLRCLRGLGPDRVAAEVLAALE